MFVPNSAGTITLTRHAAWPSHKPSYIFLMHTGVGMAVSHVTSAVPIGLAGSPPYSGNLQGNADLPLT